LKNQKQEFICKHAPEKPAAEWILADFAHLIPRPNNSWWT
jgi:hypothetical protein